MSNVVVQICLDEDGGLTVAAHAPIRPDGASAHALSEIADLAVKAYREALEASAPYLGASYADEDDEADGGD